MKNSVSDQSFYVESDGEDEKKRYNKGECDGNESDYSNDSNENQQQRKPSMYNLAWPQSYRQSIDLYGSVPSPNIGFLGPPGLSTLGGSFISSTITLTRRHSPETLPSVAKPLLQPRAEEQPVPISSIYDLLPPVPSRIGSNKHDSSIISYEVPISTQCSFGQAVLNGINVLCGVGILSTPYAVKQGGWLGLPILFMFAVLSFYTGLLLRRCLDSDPEIETYPDIGQAAFGSMGRIVISIILYMELYASCIEFIILESDNLSSIFPNAHIHLGGLELDSHNLFAFMVTLAILPTVWLRDLRILSYISACGVIATVLVVFSLFWVGLVDRVGFQSKETTFNVATLPVALGLYGFGYSGHAVFPNIYASMANRNQFPAMLFTSFGICTLMYAGVAVLGYKMFGDSTLSQYTLNMPKDLVATKIAVWTTVVNPFTKYALTLSPVAMCLEELVPPNANFYLYSIFIRTALVVSTLLVGLSIPFFGLVMSLIGSLLTMLVALIFPAACFLRVLRGRISRFEATICIIIITVGLVSSIIGTYSASSKIIESLSG